MNGSADRFAIGLAAALSATAATPAQPPTFGLRAAIAATDRLDQLPALAWLRSEFLPSLPAWPAALAADTPIALSWHGERVDVRSTDLAFPGDAVAFGTLSFDAPGVDGPELLWRCDPDGSEQWTVPAAFRMPERLRSLLHELEGDSPATARTIATQVAVAHLAGAMLEHDPFSVLMRIGPVHCGDVTFAWWRDDAGLHVRGRSDGGLMLPAVLLGTAACLGSGRVEPLSLRAFAGRDGDRCEAARQLGSLRRELDVPTLRALLFADDDVRLSAIHALVRRNASDELPNIVAAADVDSPWATLAARDAVRQLWASASPSVRAATRTSLADSPSRSLRELDLDALTPPMPTAVATEPDTMSRGAVLLILLCTSIGLLGIWRRERQRLLSPQNG